LINKRFFKNPFQSDERPSPENRHGNQLIGARICPSRDEVAFSKKSSKSPIFALQTNLANADNGK